MRKNSLKIFLSGLFLLLSATAFAREARVWQGGDVRQNYQAFYTIGIGQNSQWRIWAGGDARQNYQALYIVSGYSGEWRIWRGGDVRQNYQAIYTAKIDPTGVLRVWAGGDVRQNYQALYTISEADELPHPLLIFLIACRLGEG